ncbi:MAG: hypothetical protein ACYS1A_08195 [Planctomycetota bacterium]
MTETAIFNDIIVLCEQFEGFLPGQRKPEYYINPILKWMTAEWKGIKKLIAQVIMDVALGRTPKVEAKTDIFFPEGNQNIISQMIEVLIGNMSVEVKEQVGEAKKKANSDARPKLARGTVNVVTTVLSREGLEAVIAGLDFQKDFVDDLNLSTKQRIGRLLQSRYGTASDLRTQVDHTLRISRDGVLDDFHDDVAKIAKKMRDGAITSEKFHDDMMSSIQKQYRKMYREGKGSPLEEWEEEFVRRQAETQRQYLDNFKGYIDRKEIIGEELTSYVDNRAGLYVERGTALYEAGWVSNLPDDVLLNWVLQPAEHCSTCPVYAANSPYTKNSLPGFPGEGFDLTECGTNCKCILEVSDLYVTGE